MKLNTLLMGAVLVWGTTLALAANFQLSSAGSNIVLDGVYISPYTASIDGVPTTVICDDFADEVSVGETWQTTVSTVASLSPNVKWATDSDPLVQPYNATTEQKLYDEAAWLSGQLLATSNPTQMGEISYAIWAVFDPTGVKNWLNTYSDTTTSSAIWGTGGLLSQAASQTYYAGEFSNVSVYSPTAAPAGYGPPQEFLAVQTVRADEASTIATFGFDFTCLALLLYFFRRHLSAKLN